MKLSDYIFKIAPRAISYRLTRKGWRRPPSPLTLTFSVTAACQSLCLTCNIGRRYLADPSIIRENLTLDEIEKCFRSLGPIYFFNVSGGEPFMRPDLAEIIRLACIHLQPKLIHIPTNGLMVTTIGRTTEKIIEYMDTYAARSVPISIKPSIDGIGAVHDYIRGVDGNFAKLEQTIDTLLAISHKNPRLHIDLGTVISNYNLDHLDAIEDWVHKRGVESYRHEIAEQRAEFDNFGDPITPSVEVYEELIATFKRKIIANLRRKALLTRTTESVRLAYYDVAARILREKRQVTPCFGGISNIHLNYNGQVWPCCVLGDEQALGNVKTFNYHMRALLESEQANHARRYIAAGNCACPLANQWLNNVLLTPRHMARAVYRLVSAGLFGYGQAETSDETREPVRQPEFHPGTCSRKALIINKAGAIPEETKVELTCLRRNEDDQ